MAVASSVVCAAEPIERIRRHDFGEAGLAESGGGAMEVESPPEREVEEKVYVAVGKNVKECKSVLLWALQNCGGKKICLVHVHQPAQMIPLMGTKFPANKLREEEVRAYRVIEKGKMHKILNEYILYCASAGVRVEKLDIEMDNIERGIVELVTQRGIRRLVMGAAVDKQYSKKLTTIKSKKAIFVNQQANKSCAIWFICKGYLIRTRKGSLDEAEMGLNALPLPSPITVTAESEQLRSKSLAERQSDYRKLSNPVQDFLRRVRSDKVDSYKRRVTASSSPDIAGEVLASRNQLDAMDVASEWGKIPTRSPSQCSGKSTWSSSEEAIGSLDSMSQVRDEEKGDGSLLLSVHEEDLSCPSTQDELEKNRVDDVIYNQLLQAMAEAENSKREAFEESLRRRKAETNALEAICKAKSSESLYIGEMKRRKDMENALARETLELKTAKSELDEVVKELLIALDQKLILENQIAESDRTVKELEEKVAAALELLISVRKQRDEMLIEHDSVIRVTEELRKRIEEETACSQRPVLLSEFSFLEIEEATHNFDTSLMIGEGGYGCVYRGLLRNTEVAIKVLRSHSSQGCSEFQQEVDVLSRVKHPNLVILIGACSESGSLIYEYLPNGSLEDFLTCKDNGPPLSWQIRIRIATEICSALIFLHSNKPYSIIHGDLKPSNILLDTNFTSKLSDFGICRLIPCDKGSADTHTTCWRTTPKGTFVYMDPEFLATGELTSKSDVYSFGIILLRLLTGKPALGIVKEVEYALEKGNLSAVLDESAGDWPFMQAKQLAHLALRCCEMKRKSRPDLRSDVWRVLEPMKASFGSSSSFRLGPMEHAIPSYFVCPISREIMRDPHAAADGLTYEGDALRGWLDGGHDTSPVTGLKLAHRNIVPNYTLRSAVLEWLEQH